MNIPYPSGQELEQRLSARLLGGMASAGILGMFIGATLLALGYQIFMWWVANNSGSQPLESGPQAAGHCGT